MKEKIFMAGSKTYSWFTRFFMLTCLLFSFSVAALADSGFWSEKAANVQISDNWQGELNATNANDITLGSLTEAPVINQTWAKVWGDGAITNVYFCYTVDGERKSDVQSDNSSLGGGNQTYKWENLNITLPSTTGSHVVEFWYKTNNDKYLSNNSANYKIVYDIAGPKMECDPNNTKIIFQENFDFPALTDEKSRCAYSRTFENDGFEAWIPAKGSDGAQGYTYMEACKAMKDNGYYAVVVNAQWGGCGDQYNGEGTACDCNDAKWFRDVTSRSGSGGMLMYNGNDGTSSTPDILYACKVDVCAETYINFTAHIAPANALRPGTSCENNYDDAAVKFVLRDSETQEILATQTIRDIKLDAGWQELSAMFNSGEAENDAKEKSVTIEFVNIAPAGNCGNDLLIDDITLSVCTPKAELKTSNGTDVANIVAGQSETLTASLVSGIMDNRYYLWQSQTNKTSWVSITEPVQNSELVVTPEANPTYYRVIIARTAEEAKEVAKGGNIDACGMYAITNTVTVNANPLGLTVEPDETPICYDSEGSFTVTVTNPIEKAVNDVKVTYIVPNNLSADKNITVSTGSYSTSTNSIVWTIPTLPVGESTLQITATATEKGDATAQAYVSYLNGTSFASYDVSPSKDKGTIAIEKIEFITQPQSVPSVCEDSPVTLTVKAESTCTGTVTYQWVRRAKGSTAEFQEIAGETGTTYTINNVTATDAQYEYAVWANVSGCPCVNVISNVATITFVEKTDTPATALDYEECPVSGTQLLKELVTVTYPDNLVFYTTQTGTETAESFDKSVSFSTTYYYTYQEEGKCPSDRGELSVTVLPSPVATITSDATQQVCAEDSYTFSIEATATNGTGKWSVGSVSGGTAVIANADNANTTVTVSAGATANITWTVTAPNNKCDATASTTLIVDKKPEVNFVTNKGSQEACATSDFTVAVYEHAGTGTWSFVGESYSASITSPNAFETTVTGIQLGEKVTLQYTASNGVCSDVVSDEITLENLICNNLVLDNTVNDGEVCKNDEVIFTIQITNHSTVASTNVKAEAIIPNGLSYIKTVNVTGTYDNTTGAWNVGDLAVNAVATLQIKVKATATATLTAKVTEASSAAMDMKDDATVTVNPLPTAKFNAATSEICGSLNEASDIGVVLTGKAPYSLTYTIDGAEKTEPGIYSPYSIAQLLSEQRDYQFALTKVVDANSCVGEISGETHTVTVDKDAVVGNINEVSAICEDTELTLPSLPTVTAHGSTVSAGKWLLNGVELTSNVLTANDNGKKLQYMVESTCGTQAPKPIYSNEVTVTVDKNPSDAVIALEKIEQCNNPVFNVNANPITIGTGAWSTISGGVSNISPIDNIETNVTLNSDYIGQDAVVRWTVSNGTCTPKTDEVTLINNNCTSFDLTATGEGPKVCYNSLATFTFTLTNTATVAVNNVTLKLTYDTGLAIQSATAAGYSFVAGKCIVPTMAAGASIQIEVKAKATKDAAVVKVEVIESSQVDVSGVEASQAVTVYALPTARFDANSSVVCASENTASAIQVTFTGKPDYTLTYTVDGTTKQEIATQSPYTLPESFDKVGTYSVQLVSVTDDNGCVGTIAGEEHDVKVEKYASLGNLNEVDPICEGTTIELPSEPRVYENGSTVTNKKWMLDGVNIGATTLIPYTTEEQSFWFQLQSTCGNYSKSIESNKVTLKVDQNPTTANAGIDQTQCNNGTFVMAANTPQIGSGKWSVVGESVLTYEAGNPTTTVQGVPETKSVDLVWTISSKLGVCAASTDEVRLTNNNCANFTLEVDGEPSQICPEGTADFNFVLTNTATVAVQNVKLLLTLEEGLTLLSAKVEGLSFTNNAITIQEMIAGASVSIKVQATAAATANGKKVSITVEESSGVSVGMTVSQTVVVNQNPVITNIASYTGEDPSKPGVKPTTELTCTNSTLYLIPTVTSNNEVSYSWNTGETNKIQGVTQKGTYILQVTDNVTKCISENKSIDITENKVYPVLEDIISSNKSSSTEEGYKETTVLDCNNQSLVLNPIIKDKDGNPYTRELEFVWSEVDENGHVIAQGGTGKTETVTKEGFYIVQIIDEETGCPGESKTIEITKDVTTPVITNIISYTTQDPSAEGAKETNELTCANPVLYLNPSITSTNEVTYLWSTGSTDKVLKVEEAGTYTLVVTDVKTGCSTDAFECTITENKQVPELVLDAVYYLCPNDTLQPITLSSLLPKTEGINYQFFDEAREPIADLYDAPTADEVRTYYATATSQNGCVSEQVAFDVDFVVLPRFTIEVSESPVLAGGNQTLVRVIPDDAAITIDSYHWVANGKDLQIDDLEYIANLYLDTKFAVTASNRCGATTNEAVVVVVWPTAFTPYNKNGMNETFAKGLPLAIYNRLGIQIFEGPDGWDGIMNKNMGANTMAVPGVYYYAVQLPDGSVKKGTIEVVKF